MTLLPKPILLLFCLFTTTFALLEASNGENCLEGVNTDTCTLPDGDVGLFMCHEQAVDGISRPLRRRQDEASRSRGLGHSHHNTRNLYEISSFHLHFSLSLSPTRCIPVGSPAHGHDNASCGCCGGECPVLLDSCACACDITAHDGHVIAPGAGVWVAILRGDPAATETKAVPKCVRPGRYVDPSRVSCVPGCFGSRA